MDNACCVPSHLTPFFVLRIYDFRKSIISTVAMSLRPTFRLNFLHGPLPCSSSCHRSSGERLCMSSMIEFTRYYSACEKKCCSEDLKKRYFVLQLILHQESDNSAQLSQVCDMAMVSSSSSELILHNY